MEIEKLELYRSIAEMAYVIAKADKGLSSQERIAFYDVIQKELDYDSWAAQSRFELLDEVIDPSLDKTYNDAINDFKRYKKHVTPEVKEKTIRVMQKVADACNGFNEKEAFIIDRVKRDLDAL
ncbi:MAG TPA: TerB family tellurite resistance protein [Chryseosolibacter sp.]|nr:TerB family tellurite resistance protein [Chryseosolibacter sp.]